MTNNDILLSVRNTFDFDNSKMVTIFGLADLEVTCDQVNGWLEEKDNQEYQAFTDLQLAVFLNGLINYKRGKKEGAQPEAEILLTNNAILMKLKIALDLKADDVLDIMNLVDIHISKYELSAFFRKPYHKNYRACRDKILRNFLKGVHIKYHDTAK